MGTCGYDLHNLLVISLTITTNYLFKYNLDNVLGMLLRIVAVGVRVSEVEVGEEVVLCFVLFCFGCRRKQF
jgi:threonine dehydrogenase-like Zn-dependent dehydrogenase